jgi:signal transduction histidine kinase
MYEGVIVILDVVSAVGFAAALVIVLNLRAGILDHVSKTLFALVLGIYVLVGMANILEHASITAYFDRYEDYLEILFPLTFTYFLYSVIVNRELDRRKQAEEALNSALMTADDAKNRFEAVIAAVGDGISIHDTSFKILYQNRVHRELLGDHAGEFCYKAYRRRDQVCDDCGLAMSFRTGGVHTVERCATIGAKIVNIEVTTSPLRNYKGDIIAGIEVVRDITIRKKLEAQQAHMRKMEAMGQIAGALAHDFNNILTGITGYGSIIMKAMMDGDPLRRHVEQILASTKKAKALTRGLLTFGKKQVVNPRPVQLQGIIENAQKFLPRIVGERIAVKVALADRDLTIIADSDQIEEVLLGMAANARDAMPNGGSLTIGAERFVLDDEFVRVHGYGRHGAYARISLSDTGTGMTEETIASIFDPFFSTKNSGEGAGLGLAIAYGVVKQHNGYITVESEVGKGSTFCIYLPLM